MGQLISFPASRTDAGETAECVLLIAVRCWVDDLRHGKEPVRRLSQDLASVGAREAAFSVDALMAILIRTLRRPIEIHCPGCPHLSPDEQHLLHAARLAQMGEAQLAEQTLHTALLSAQGASFALGPLEGLAQLFARVGLLFNRWRSPAMALSQSDAGEAWPPSRPFKTIQ